MRSAIVFVLLLLLSASLVGAETVITPINITTGSEQAAISTEEWSASYNCNATGTNNRFISFQRSFTTPQLEDCRNSLNNLSVTMVELSAAFKDSKAYAPLYTQCFSDLTLCKNSSGELIDKVKGKETAEGQLRGCQDGLQTANSDKRIVQEKLDACAIDLANSQEEAKQKGENQMWWGAAGLALGLGGYHFFINKKFTVQSQIEKDIPK